MPGMPNVFFFIHSIHPICKWRFFWVEAPEEDSRDKEKIKGILGWLWRWTVIRRKGLKIVSPWHNCWACTLWSPSATSRVYAPQQKIQNVTAKFLDVPTKTWGSQMYQWISLKSCISWKSLTSENAEKGLWLSPSNHHPQEKEHERINQSQSIPGSIRHRHRTGTALTWGSWRLHSTSSVSAPHTLNSHGDPM